MELIIIIIITSTLNPSFDTLNTWPRCLACAILWFICFLSRFSLNWTDRTSTKIDRACHGLAVKKFCSWIIKAHPSVTRTERCCLFQGYMLRQKIKYESENCLTSRSFGVTFTACSCLERNPRDFGDGDFLSGIGIHQSNSCRTTTFTCPDMSANSQITNKHVGIIIERARSRTSDHHRSTI